ncbi:hypothetical protein FJZ31_22265 [Candidatus Poribacteria bacterium]|nr:hypothetical protein [Candidatus Poribacteria bacterium]
MLCPFCLSEVKFKSESVDGKSVYICPNCTQQVPALYVQEYPSYPPVVANAIGFRGHGKTVYFAALFYALKKLGLSLHWPNFHTMGIDEESLDTVYENVAMLEEGKLPASTPKIFPRPTMVRVEGIPMQSNCTLLFYDTGGEAFEKATQLVMYASFVKQARTAMFLISPCDINDPTMEMHKLLNTYVVGMAELGASARHQHLVVVYTKADEMVELLEKYSDIEAYLRRGTIDELVSPKHYMRGMYSISEQLREFTKSNLGANEFLNAADANFKSVSFCIISALGARPQGQQTSVQITPRRILDPMLWLMEKSLPGWKQTLRRWWE